VPPLAWDVGQVLDPRGIARAFLRLADVDDPRPVQQSVGDASGIEQVVGVLRPRVLSSAGAVEAWVAADAAGATAEEIHIAGGVSPMGTGPTRCTARASRTRTAHALEFTSAEARTVRPL
jgi:hypothetical protein